MINLGENPLTIVRAAPIEKFQSIEDDFERSRRNLLEVMEVTKGAIQNLSVIAFQSQMPDAYDVLNKLIKEYAGQQSQLLQIYRIKAAKEVQSQNSTPTSSITGETVDARTQNVFVGTPADLARVLDGMKKDAGE